MKTFAAWSGSIVVVAPPFAWAILQPTARMEELVRLRVGCQPLKARTIAPHGRITYAKVIPQPIQVRLKDRSEGMRAEQLVESLAVNRQQLSCKGFGDAS